MLSRLIIINILVWIFVKVVLVITSLYRTPQEYAEILLMTNLAVPAYLPSLLSRPWTIFTYMFLHFDFLHILFNMLWLYWFGKIFLTYLSQRKLLITYIAGGIAGALLYILFYNTFPLFEDSLRNSMALGASASVMAIVMGISFYVPNYNIQLIFIGPVKIIYLALILFILDFFSMSGTNSGGHIAHIGGALFGVLYVLFLKKAPYANGNRGNFAKSFSSAFTRKQKASSNSHASRPMSDEEYNISKTERQQKIDTILEKISKGGYDSLTKEEKDYLFKASGKKN
ncbi:MAG: rhomboid family intramembrane serine protease [Syntrophothermus sp.]